MLWGLHAATCCDLPQEGWRSASSRLSGSRCIASTTFGTPWEGQAVGGAKCYLCAPRGFLPPELPCEGPERGAPRLRILSSELWTSWQGLQERDWGAVIGCQVESTSYALWSESGGGGRAGRREEQFAGAFPFPTPQFLMEPLQLRGWCHLGPACHPGGVGC